MLNFDEWIQNVQTGDVIGINKEGLVYYYCAVKTVRTVEAYEGSYTDTKLQFIEIPPIQHSERLRYRPVVVHANWCEMDYIVLELAHLTDTHITTYGHTFSEATLQQLVKFSHALSCEEMFMQFTWNTGYTDTIYTTNTTTLRERRHASSC